MRNFQIQLTKSNKQYDATVGSITPPDSGYAVAFMIQYSIFLNDKQYQFSIVNLKELPNKHCSSLPEKLTLTDFVNKFCQLRYVKSIPELFSPSQIAINFMLKSNA